MAATEVDAREAQAEAEADAMRKAEGVEDIKIIVPDLSKIDLNPVAATEVEAVSEAEGEAVSEAEGLKIIMPGLLKINLNPDKIETETETSIGIPTPHMDIQKKQTAILDQMKKSSGKFSSLDILGAFKSLEIEPIAKSETHIGGSPNYNKDVYEKLLNVFINYIVNYNLFKNSFLIKKLQNISNTSKYKNDKSTIDNDLKKNEGPNLNSNLDDYLKNNFTFAKYDDLIKLLKNSITNEANEANESTKDFYIKELANLFILNKPPDIDEINKIMFQYITLRFKTIYEKLENNHMDGLVIDEYLSDLKLILTFYSIIQVLTQHFSLEFELITQVEAKQATIDILEKYSESEVISYIKIRDNVTVYNPRYMYYTNHASNDNEKKTSTNHTLSLLYCNELDNTININVEGANAIHVGGVDATKTDAGKKAANTVKHDHLFHYGYFDKILYNENNREFGYNMERVINKLEDEKDVFIIGCGTPDSGKSKTLIYDNNDTDNPDGAIVYMLQKLASDSNNDYYKSLYLTMYETFMDDDIIGEIKTLKKVNDLPFIFNPEKKIFSIEVTFIEFKSFMEPLNDESNKDNLDDDLKRLWDSIEKNQTGAGFLDFLGFSGKSDSDNDPENNKEPIIIKKEISLSLILQLLINKKRKISATPTNSLSPRSHAIGIIKFRKDENKEVRLIIGDFAEVENKLDYKFEYLENIRIKIETVLANKAMQKAESSNKMAEETEKKAVADWATAEAAEKVAVASWATAEAAAKAAEKLAKKGLVGPVTEVKAKAEAAKAAAVNAKVVAVNAEAESVKAASAKAVAVKAVAEAAVKAASAEAAETATVKAKVVAVNAEAESVEEAGTAADDVAVKVVALKAAEGAVLHVTSDSDNGHLETINSVMKTLCEKNIISESIYELSIIKRSDDENIYFYQANWYWNNKNREKMIAMVKFLNNHDHEKSYDFNELTIPLPVTNNNESQYGGGLFDGFFPPSKNEVILEESINSSQILFRIVQMHYELINRTYEGIFINRSLQSMRSTMTNVLKAKSKDSKPIPNFNSKCMSYYKNPVTYDMFENETEDNRNSDPEHDKFNTIHQILSATKKGNVFDNLQKYTDENISNNLKDDLIYCLCLVLNNSYSDHEGEKLNNPPKIPYIDLRNGYIELERFTKITQASMNNTNYYKQIIFKGKAEVGETTIHLAPNIKEKFEDYKYSFEPKLNNEIFKAIQNNILASYPVAVEKKNILEYNLKDIKNKFETLIPINESLSKNPSSEAIITAIKNYLYEIEQMNATSVIGTLDFADQISKYNLKFNSCSIVENDILYDSIENMHLYGNTDGPMLDYWNEK